MAMHDANRPNVGYIILFDFYLFYFLDFFDGSSQSTTKAPKHRCDQMQNVPLPILDVWSWTRI